MCLYQYIPKISCISNYFSIRFQFPFIHIENVSYYVVYIVYLLACAFVYSNFFIMFYMFIQHGTLLMPIGKGLILFRCEPLSYPRDLLKTVAEQVYGPLKKIRGRISCHLFKKIFRDATYVIAKKPTLIVT